ncbi:metal-sensing transcriptional repressor [Streptomyces sp. NPDC002588]|uniref:metal-sensing transcriptional repressor n=1 Tax=Streptomyces sp. NPDC002588 TaxID=3154419 RepID=UPI00332CA2F0
MERLEQVEARQAPPGYHGDKEAVLKRLRRIEGQVPGLQRAIGAAVSGAGTHALPRRGPPTDLSVNSGRATADPASPRRVLARLWAAAQGIGTWMRAPIKKVSIAAAGMRARAGEADTSFKMACPCARPSGGRQRDGRCQRRPSIPTHL